MAENTVSQAATDGKRPPLSEGYYFPLSPEMRQKRADRARLMLALAGIRSDLTPIAAGDLPGLRGETTRLLAYLDPADLLAVNLLVMALADVGPADGWRGRLQARGVMR